MTGRFQPVHEQHLELFEIALRASDHLIVAVTNPDSTARRAEPTSAHRHLAEANPFTYFERAQLLQAALAGRGLTGRATIVPFDLTRPESWADYVPRHARHVVRAYGPWERRKASLLADAGYAVTVIDGDPATKISATDIRARLSGDPSTWVGLVPAAVAPVLADVLSGGPAGGTAARG